MNKKLSLFLGVMLLVLSLIGCSNSPSKGGSTVPTDQIHLDRKVSEIMNRGGYTSSEIIHNPNSETHTDSVSVVFKKNETCGRIVRTDTCVYSYNRTSDTWSYHNNQGWRSNIKYEYNDSSFERTWSGKCRDKENWYFQVTITNFDSDAKKVSAYGSIYDDIGNEYGSFSIKDYTLRPTDGSLYINGLPANGCYISFSLSIKHGIVISIN